MARQVPACPGRHGASGHVKVSLGRARLGRQGGARRADGMARQAGLGAVWLGMSGRDEVGLGEAWQARLGIGTLGLVPAVARLGAARQAGQVTACWVRFRSGAARQARHGLGAWHGLARPGRQGTARRG